MLTIIGVVSLIAIILLLSYQLFRRYPITAWIVFLVVPFPLIAVLIKNGLSDVFIWIKLHSVYFGICCLQAYRTTSLGSKKWLSLVIYLILFFNILEAVIVDITGGQTDFYLNAAAGFLLMITIPGIRTISVGKNDEKSRFNDLEWDLPLGWIIGYTIWNLQFIYLNYPGYVFCNFAVLGIPLLIGIINNKHWFQARAFTLGFYLMVIYISNDLFEALPTPGLENAAVRFGASIVSIVFMLTYTVWFFVNKYRSSRNVS
ncbi:MAG: hypothetical protein GY754_32375 [bacterium]|nr:hypothetical protein [bacterium]